MKHGNSIFKVDGPAGERSGGGGSHWRTDATLLEKWKTGQTGLPLIDANMRELAATGFMSNRGRQNVASYLALDLQLDWRYGAAHFEALLLDVSCVSSICFNAC